MPPTSFSGSLQPKKKQELQDLANALQLSASGTKDELQLRIRQHLDANEQELSEQPTFSGLYGRRKPVTRKGSVAAGHHEQESSSDEVNPPQARKVSRMVHPPILSASALPNPKPSDSPSSLPPLPPSPVRSLLSDATHHAVPDADKIVKAVKGAEARLVTEAEKSLAKTRTFLSNAGNISSITVLLELFYIIYVIVPWAYLLIPLNPPFTSNVDKRSPKGVSTAILSLPYPPLSYILTSHLYKTLCYWAIPTLLVPQSFGALISFSTPRKEVDPLSASIVRLASAVAGTWGLGEEILGPKWRILAASISVAFAFAEAVQERRGRALVAQDA